MCFGIRHVCGGMRILEHLYFSSTSPRSLMPNLSGAEPDACNMSWSHALAFMTIRLPNFNKQTVVWWRAMKPFWQRFFFERKSNLTTGCCALKLRTIWRESTGTLKGSLININTPTEHLSKSPDPRLPHSGEKFCIYMCIKAKTLVAP